MFVHSTALDAIRAFLDACTLPALPILNASFLHRRFGAFGVTLEVALYTLGKFTFVAANVARIRLRFASAAHKKKVYFLSLLMFFS